MRLVTSLFLIVAVSACADVGPEQKTSFAYDGETYPAVIREFRTESGTFSRRSIRFKSVLVRCSATDDQDCIAAIREFDEFSRS